MGKTAYHSYAGTKLEVLCITPKNAKKEGDWVKTVQLGHGLQFKPEETVVT